MLTSDGYPQRPRDLTLGIYKGEHDPASIFRRLRLGLPGSSMPANELLSDQEIADCVHYCLSLSSEEVRNSNIMKRQRLTAKKIAQAPATPDDAAWKDVPAAKLVVTPLWWVLGYKDPGLAAQAAHDGKNLSIRITWQDASKNDAPYRVDQFEDLVAVQLTTVGAANEPFIAMGDQANQLDMWLWRAGWQTPYPESDSQMDTYPFEDAATKAAAGAKAPDFLTARAAGNLNVNADRKQTAGNLGAKGAGSLTFRPKASQVVTAKAGHKDGSWTVVLTRPLAVGAEEGVSLKPGSTSSITFAIWDGEVHDRDGQKKISLWNDLALEQ
jgi:DMSO reductase family type II enzyme heme b subunit